MLKQKNKTSAVLIVFWLLCLGVLTCSQSAGCAETPLLRGAKEGAPLQKGPNTLISSEQSVEWSALANQVEVLEMQKRIAKLQAEIRELESRGKIKPPHDTKEQLRKEIQELVAKMLAQKEKEQPKEVTPKEQKQMLPRLCAVFGAETLQARVRFMSGEVMTVQAGQRLLDWKVLRIERNGILLQRGSERCTLLMH